MTSTSWNKFKETLKVNGARRDEHRLNKEKENVVDEIAAEMDDSIRSCEHAKIRGELWKKNRGIAHESHAEKLVQVGDGFDRILNVNQQPWPCQSPGLRDHT